MDVTLDKMPAGRIGVVVGLPGRPGIARHLQSLGIRVGKNVTKVSSQLMRGPVTIRIDGFQVAVGFGMAKKILVKTRQ